MNEILTMFSRFIVTYEILLEYDGISVVGHKARITFTDGCVLVYTDMTIVAEARRKYSFQWMNPNAILHMRWDNALHHPHIATYPNHKHVGSEKNIQESPEMTLEDVLLIITTTLE
jgi:hypothetical protein